MYIYIQDVKECVVIWNDTTDYAENGEKQGRTTPWILITSKC